MPQVRVDGLDRSLELPPGANLYRALKQEHVNLHWTVLGKMFNCRGIGLCGLCRVRVVEGAETLPERTKREERRLKGAPADWRLACQIEVRGDLRIEPFPLQPLEDRFGADAVEMAKRPVDEREEWFSEDRGARRVARREAAIKKVGTPPKRRGLLARLVSRKKKDDPEEEETLETDEVAEGPKKRGFGRKKGTKEKKPARPAKQKEKEAGGKKKSGSGRGLALRRKKKGGDDEGDA